MKKTRIIALCVIVAVVVTGTIIVLSTRAATPYLSQEAESAVPLVTTVPVVDSTASGGQAIKFAAGKTWASGDYAPPAVRIFDKIVLGYGSIMQAFTYEQTNKLWFFAQAKDQETGEMVLSKVSSAGKVLGTMTLKGFGHGVSIGVEPVGNSFYMYTESTAKLASGGDMYGTKISRFVWKDDQTVSTSTSGVTTYDVNPGATEQTPMVDAARNRIVISYLPKGSSRKSYAVFALDKFKNKDFTPLSTTVSPAELTTIPHLQGWLLLNDETILTYHGTQYKDGNDAPGNGTINEFSVPSGKFVRRVLVTAGSSLDYREPEGLANINGNICAGFATGTTGKRKATIYCQMPIQ